MAFRPAVDRPPRAATYSRWGYPGEWAFGGVVPPLFPLYSRTALWTRVMGIKQALCRFHTAGLDRAIDARAAFARQRDLFPLGAGNIGIRHEEGIAPPVADGPVVFVFTVRADAGFRMSDK